MLGLLELMPQAPAAAAYVRMMQDEGTRINLLLSELLALGQPHPTERMTRDLTAKLRDVIRLLSAEAATHAVITLRHPEAPIRVGCDPNQLKQALVNIVKSAIEARPPGGTVDVSIHAPHRMPSVFVSSIRAPACRATSSSASGNHS